MSDVKKIFKEKSFPSFITSHNIFKSVKEINKVFPEIGLPNIESDIEIDNNDEVKTAALTLLNEVNQTIDIRLNGLKKFVAKKPDIGNKRKNKLQNISKLLSTVKENIAKSKNEFLVSNNGKITINLPTDIADETNKVKFKTGEGLFRVYNKLNDTLRDGHFLAMEKLENLCSFKNFSAKNVPASKYKIRFSSDGTEGAWDIVTMSMRGISSCQSWEKNTNYGNALHVVGSLIDPFTGIIYLTSGYKYNEYGSKMIRRCVVRFIVDEKTKKPLIALERMYPAHDKASLVAFISFIQNKTDNKFKVIYLQDHSHYNKYVPMSKAVSKLGEEYKPYRDSQMQYKADVNCGTITSQFSNKAEVIYDAFADKIITAVKSLKIKSLPEGSKSAYKILSGRDYYTDKSEILRQKLRKNISDFFQIFSTKKKHTNSNLLLKEAIESFATSSLEETIFTVIKKTAKSFVMTDKIDDSIIKEIAKIGSIKAINYMNSSLKKIDITTQKSMVPIYAKLLE